MSFEALHTWCRDAMVARYRSVRDNTRPAWSINKPYAEILKDLDVAETAVQLREAKDVNIAMGLRGEINEAVALQRTLRMQYIGTGAKPQSAVDWLRLGALSLLFAIRNNQTLHKVLRTVRTVPVSGMSKVSGAKK